MDKKKLKKKIKSLQAENAKHDDGIAKAQAQLRSSKVNLAQEQERADRQVQSTLRDHFESSSTGGLLDRVLKMEMSEPKLTQLRATINKMATTIDFHEMEKRENQATISQLEGKISEIELKEKIETLKDSFQDFVGIAGKLDQPFSQLTKTLSEVQGLTSQQPAHNKKHWSQILRDNGTDLWMVTVLDSILPRLSGNHFAELVFQLSVFNNPDNPIYSASMHRARQDTKTAYTRDRMNAELGDYVNPAEAAAERLI